MTIIFLQFEDKGKARPGQDWKGKECNYKKKLGLRCEF